MPNRPEADRTLQGNRSFHLAFATAACLLVLCDPIARGEEVVVPDLTRLSAQQAGQQLRGLSLAPKFLLGPAPIDAQQALQVISQEPPAGSSVNIGTTVRVTIYAQAPETFEPSGIPSDNPTSQSASAAVASSRGTADAITSGPPIQLAPRRRIADHYISLSDILAIDMNHGLGSAQLQVARQWNHAESPAETTGPGWGDRNVIRQLVEADRIVLVRGGRKETSLPRLSDDQFGAGSVVVMKSTSGWEWTISSGEKLVFNSNHQLVSVTSPAGGNTSYTWDVEGRLEKVRKGSSSVLNYYYDGDSSRVTRIEGPEGLVCRYEYDATGRLKSVSNAHRVRVVYEYDSEGELAELSDPFGCRLDLKEPEQIAAAQANPAAKRQGDTRQQLRQLMNGTDELTIATVFAAAVRPPADPEIERDQAGRVIRETRHGRVTEYHYDQAGQLAEVETPEGCWSFEYDEFGRRRGLRQPDGKTLTYDFTPAGQVGRVAGSDGTLLQIEYDDHDRPTLWRFGDGRTVEARYGADGRRSFVRWSPDLSASYQFAATDEVQRISLSTGCNVTFDYDERGRQVSQTSSAGTRTEFRFDEEDRVSSITWGDLKRDYEWSPEGLLVGINDPIFGQRRFDFSRLNEGEVSYSRQGLGVWRREINLWGQPISFQRPSGQTWRYKYGAMGLLSGITTPGGRSWQYGRDPAGRIVSVTSSDRPGIELTRDSQGRITQVRRSGLTQREFTRGTDGRIEVVKTPLGMVAAYVRDQADRIVEIQGADGRIQVNYDEHGQLQQLTGPNYEIRQEFHSDGQLAARTYQPMELKVAMPRDAKGRPGGVTFNGISVAYGYDQQGAGRELVAS